MSFKSIQNPLIQRLADCIETIWHQYLVLSPFAMPENLGYVEGILEGERLIIENRCYQAPQFRKLHLEVAQIGTGLNVLHCVMFPKPTYALPIFGTDLVGKPKGGMSAAIVDLSPVNSELSLPPAYHEALSTQPRPHFSQPRKLPDWGYIFSEFCSFIRPMGQEEEEQFFHQAQAFLLLHCQLACTASPLSSAQEIQQVLLSHQHYCNQQRKNDKTRRVLEKSFGAEWADRYINTMLFDPIVL